MFPRGWWSWSRQGRSPVPRQVVPGKVGAKQLGPAVRLAASSAPLAPLSIMSSLRSPVEGPCQGRSSACHCREPGGTGQAELAHSPASLPRSPSVESSCPRPSAPCLCAGTTSSWRAASGLLGCLGYFVFLWVSGPLPSPWFPEVSHHLLHPCDCPGPGECRGGSLPARGHGVHVFILHMPSAHGVMASAAFRPGI